MKVKLLSLSFIFVRLVCVSQEIKTNSNCDKIYWTADRILKWQDFKASSTDTLTTYLGKADVVSAVFLNCVRDDVDPTTYKVFCYFDKSKSWAKSKTSPLLNHEQLHFDICELFARGMRKKIDSLHVSEIDDLKIYEETIDKVYLEMDRYQELFDLQTGHGMARVFQDEWSRKISIELGKLDKYASTSKDCL